MSCVCQGCKKALSVLSLIHDWLKQEAIILVKKYMENKEKSEGEAEVEVVEEKKTESFLGQDSGTENKRKISNYFNVRIILLFVLGVLLGFVIKSWSAQTLVTGANDPQLEKTRGDYLLSTMGREEATEDENNEENAETEGTELDAEEGAGEELETETGTPAEESVPVQ